MTVTAALYVAGQLVPGSAADTVDPSGLYATGDLTVTWGRENTTDQPDPSSCSFTLVRPVPVTWLRLGAPVLVTVNAAAAGGPFVAFLGSVTSLTMRWDDDLGPAVDVIADDVLADLGNRSAGSAPWPSEPLAARVAHVLAAARQDVAYTIGANIAGVVLAPQDVDTATAGDVLGDVAASVDGVCWSSAAKVTGVPVWSPALWFEDPADRPALRRLAKPAALIVIVFDAAAVAADALTLDGCVFDRDDAQFSQTVEDAVTGVAVTYYTADPSDVTAPWVGTTVLSRDAVAESPTGTWGVRRIDLDTLLTTAVDAQAVGDRIVARLRPAGAWEAPALQFDQAVTPAITDAQVLALLDIARRNGQAVVVPLPTWAPAPELVGYLEGATATYTAGSWALTLSVSSGLSYGAADVAWNDLPDDPAWCWNNWDPAIAWDDLNGVAPRVGGSPRARSPHQQRAAVPVGHRQDGGRRGRDTGTGRSDRPAVTAVVLHDPKSHRHAEPDNRCVDAVDDERHRDEQRHRPDRVGAGRGDQPGRAVPVRAAGHHGRGADRVAGATGHQQSDR